MGGKTLSIRHIKAIRALLGITQQQLADAVGLHPSTMSKIEAGQLELSTRNNERILREFAASGIAFSRKGGKVTITESFT